MLSVCFVLYLGRKVPCLEYLTAKEIEVLSHTFGIVKLQAGSVIYKTGDAADRLYVVLKGAVFEYSDRRKSKEEQVIHSKGSFFGEQALFTVEPRSTTTIAGDAKPLDIGAELHSLLFYFLASCMMLYHTFINTCVFCTLEFSLSA